MENIKIVPFGCRLNTLESEKIRSLLAAAGVRIAIIVNTCAVTGEAERQSRQTVRKLSRENPGVPIYITGCAATRSASDYAKIPGVAAVVPNKDKFNINAYCPPTAHPRKSSIFAGPGASNFASLVLCDSPQGGSSSLSAITPPLGGVDARSASVGGHHAISNFQSLSKAFVQIQNGCNHACTYCITRILRGPAVSFPYEKILADTRALVDAGYGEIVLTGVDIAGWRSDAGDFPAPARGRDRTSYERSELEVLGWGKKVNSPTQELLSGRAAKPTLSRPVNGAGFISDLCRDLLRDVPGIKRLRLSSLDPGVDLKPIVDLMRETPRLLPHLHLSMQSGSDTILTAMRRRHNAQMVRDLVKYANNDTAVACPPTGSCFALADSPQGGSHSRKQTTPPLGGVDARSASAGGQITFSWDLICGFPGETPELFAATCELIHELKPIRLHAFPFSPRPGTPAATMPNQIDRAESKRRVKVATDIARENMAAFMKSQIGTTANVLVEESNIARDVNDIPVKIVPATPGSGGQAGEKIPARTIMDVKITGIEMGKELYFTAIAGT